MSTSTIFTTVNVPQTIQLATAPVFFLAGIGAFMNVIASRLARVVDRARLLEVEVPSASTSDRQRHIRELRILEKRMSFASRSISLCTASGLTVCLLIITLFLERLTKVPLGDVVAVMFVIAVLLLASGMLLFLRETRLAVGSLHVREEMIEWGAKESELDAP